MRSHCVWNEASEYTALNSFPTLQQMQILNALLRLVTLLSTEPCKCMTLMGKATLYWTKPIHLETNTKTEYHWSEASSHRVDFIQDTNGISIV
jgi:hypothetical protein